MVTLKRSLYQLIVRLHPAPFRNRFAREMSLDFEDALATFGFSHLFLDATGSLARQWTTAPIFAAPQQQAPATSHPLLAGQYVVLEGDPLTPFEFLRGTLLFVALLFALGLAFNAPSHSRTLAGNLPGLPANQADIFHHAQDGAFQPTPNQPGRNAVLIRPDEYLRQHPESARYFAHPRLNGHAIASLPETWSGFLLRCAIISAIVWLIALLVRRSRTVGVRVALVALGAIAVFAAAMYVPTPAPPMHAQALQGKFALADYQLPLPLRDLSFQAATIRLSRPAPGGPRTPASAPAGAPGIVSGDGIRLTLPIRSLIASASGMSESRIVGGPAWLDSDTYNIQAKIDGPLFASMQQMSSGQQQYQIDLMEQSLLVARFHLKAHEEARTPPSPAFAQPVEVLVIDHIDRPTEN